MLSCATGASLSAGARVRRSRTAPVCIQHSYAALERNPCASCTPFAHPIASLKGTSHLRALFLASYALQLDHSIATHDFHRRPVLGCASYPPPHHSARIHCPSQAVLHCHPHESSRRTRGNRSHTECVLSAEYLAGIWRHTLLNDTTRYSSPEQNSRVPRRTVCGLISGRPFWRFLIFLMIDESLNGVTHRRAQSPLCHAQCHIARVTTVFPYTT